MKLKATLSKPFTIKERADFVILYNGQQGCDIKETLTALEAWEYTQGEQLQKAKESKYQEANSKANEYLQSGEALYEFEPNKHIEATDGNIGKFTGYMVGYILGQLQPTDTVVWNTKEDETVNLNQAQIGSILQGLGQVQAVVWAVQYPVYVNMIENAQTVEEVEAIEINYESVGE